MFLGCVDDLRSASVHLKLRLKLHHGRHDGSLLFRLQDPQDDELATIALQVPLTARLQVFQELLLGEEDLLLRRRLLNLFCIYCRH